MKLKFLLSSQSKIILTVVCLVLVTILGLTTLKIRDAYSQQCDITGTSTNSVVQNGLATAKNWLAINLPVILSNSSCLSGTNASVDIKSLDNFGALKSLYFDQVNITNKKTLTGNKTTTDIKNNMAPSETNLILVQGNLVLDSTPISPAQTNTIVAIFVTGKIDVKSNIAIPASSGLVLISGSDINIWYEASNKVTQLSAFMITFGKFCSAYDGTVCPSSIVNVGTDQLNVNGSVISAYNLLPPQFMRRLTDNSTPAEKFIFEPKYLLITKPIFAKDKIIWGEIK